MDEIREIILRHKHIDLDERLARFEGLVRYSCTFYRDVADIFDAITRLTNTEKNPTGYELNDAAVLGLLVRIWKILKEVVFYYEQNNGDMISHLDRQVLEAAIVARYLMAASDDVIEDYRKCSYKSRLETLKRAETEPEFFETPPGKRLIASINEKLAREGWTPDSFDTQRKRRWKLQGKTFYDIFATLEDASLYKFIYGMSSESIHGSWNDSMDFHLLQNKDGTFSANPFNQPVDIRMVTPLLRVCVPSYSMWLDRIGAEESYASKALEWVTKVNGRLFAAFESAFAQRGDPAEISVKGESFFVQAFIEPDLWDEARWKAVGFETADRGPQVMAFVFENYDAGKRIFDGWLDRLGRVDRYEELRVSIITGDIPGKEPGYTVMISSEPRHTGERARDHNMQLDVDKCLIISRYHRMNPTPDSTHLARFRAAFDREARYDLVPMSMDGEVGRDFSISKHALHFVDAGTVTPNDIECAVLTRDDSEADDASQEDS